MHIEFKDLKLYSFFCFSNNLFLFWLSSVFSLVKDLNITKKLLTFLVILISPSGRVIFLLFITLILLFSDVLLVGMVKLF